MHILFATRGIKHACDLWEGFMQSQAYPFKRKQIILERDKNGNVIPDPKNDNRPKVKMIKDKKTGKMVADGVMKTETIQGALRPIRLYEYVFPEESYDDVMANLGLEDNAEFTEPQLKLLAKGLRTITGHKKPPKVKKGMPITRLMRVPGVAVSVIGVKKDKRKIWPEEGVEQEML